MQFIKSFHFCFLMICFVDAVNANEKRGILSANHFFFSTKRDELFYKLHELINIKTQSWTVSKYATNLGSSLDYETRAVLTNCHRARVTQKKKRKKFFFSYFKTFLLEIYKIYFEYISNKLKMFEFFLFIPEERSLNFLSKIIEYSNLLPLV